MRCQATETTLSVYMKVMNKQPGHSSEPIISELDLTYKSRFSEHYIPDAYESLILDVMRGDHSNFVRYARSLLNNTHLS